jgi:hypothetical protein
MTPTSDPDAPRDCPRPSRDEACVPHQLIMRTPRTDPQGSVELRQQIADRYRARHRLSSSTPSRSSRWRLSVSCHPGDQPGRRRRPIVRTSTTVPEHTDDRPCDTARPTRSTPWTVRARPCCCNVLTWRQLVAIFSGCRSSGPDGLRTGRGVSPVRVRSGRISPAIDPRMGSGRSASRSRSVPV